MKTELERASDCIVRLYHQYCVLNPVDDYLQPKEFQKFMMDQAPAFLKKTMPANDTESEYIQKLFVQADKSEAGFLTFDKFMSVMKLMIIEAHADVHQ